jgi:hypothetical protein
MKTYVSVYPTEDGQWGVYTPMNKFQFFRLDLRFGLRIAIYNFLYVSDIPVKYISWIYRKG